MQSGPAVAAVQTGGLKTDEAEEELKRKSSQVVHLDFKQHFSRALLVELSIFSVLAPSSFIQHLEVLLG